MSKKERRKENFNCSKILQPVIIDIETTSLYDDGSDPLPIALQMVPLTCSGFSICKLFPLAKFPSLELVSTATGCPYIDSLRKKGK